MEDSAAQEVPDCLLVGEAEGPQDSLARGEPEDPVGVVDSLAQEPEEVEDLREQEQEPEGAGDSLAQEVLGWALAEEPEVVEDSLAQEVLG